MTPACPLCQAPGGHELWRDALCRVVAVDDAALPGFLRVVVNTHVAEMTDLGPTERAHLMQVVMATESLMRSHLHPDKVNLASLGNAVPHVHWHVVPRWRDDRWYPDPIWAAPLRAATALEERFERASSLRAHLPAGLDRALREGTAS